MHFGGEGFVFDELEIIVFKHHLACCGGHVFAHFKQALIGHRHMALLNVVQQVLNAFGNAFALGVNGFLLCFGVEGQVVARCCCCGPLLDGKLQTCFGFVVGLSRVHQTHHGACVEQISRRCESRHRVVRPCLIGEASVFELWVGMQRLIP